MENTTIGTSPAPRSRIRDLFPRIVIGRHRPGPTNSLTDVPGVLVSTQSFNKPNTAEPETVPGSDSGVRTRHAVHTGITTILPRQNWFNEGCFAGTFSFNGYGELTGSHLIDEAGLLCSPIIITSTFAIGACHTGVFEYAVNQYADEQTGLTDWALLPVVAETCDLYLTDIGAMPITSKMAVKGIETASTEPVAEGNTGGGTGMFCHGSKGGTGSASRTIKGKVIFEGEDEKEVEYTVATLVQANYGKKWDLHIGRVPVGKLMMDPKDRQDQEKNQGQPGPKGPMKDGSIIVVVATDAPLHPAQLQRLAKRATVGLARVGGWGSNSSGDIFMAFSTSEKLPRLTSDGPFDTTTRQKMNIILDETSNALFEAVADCTEESIYNALCMAEDTEGPLGRSAKAIDLEHLQELLEKHYVD
ncbi:hypothetical protein D9619_006206 [Psilocybe cf. subviscida]|uniref:Uncharacterized protein n=1 Tax=Psilocybe cf. subviscida TaxID=2480587 RepID=A0A8H5EXA9_9AGAR|nr:hypothetical protein D9619_006206 [Psilocybe cf. subviscida]